MNNITEPAKYPLLCLDCAGHLIMDSRVLVRRDEYYRLKQLYDNFRCELMRKREILEECVKEGWKVSERRFKDEI